MSDHTVWNESKEASLLNDPRYEAGLMSRQSGEYEASIDFFAELLKSFDGDDNQLHLAPLYFNYASSMVCNIENRMEEGEGAEQEDEDDSEQVGGGAAAEGEDPSPSLKRSREENNEREGKSAKIDSIESDKSAKGDGEEEEEEEEEEGDEEDETAWQCLDMARDLYQRALAYPSISVELEKRLKQDLARTTSRIGDLNMIQSKFGDALIEYELCLKLRGDNKETSVENICRLSDANMQVAFAYLEHLADHGAVDVVAASSDGSNIVVARGDECVQQAMAFRDQAKTSLENLISRLARDRVNCTPEEKELICVQYQLLSDFSDRMAEVSAANQASCSSSNSSTSASN